MVAKNIVSSKQGLLPTPSMPKGLSKAQLTDNARHSDFVRQASRLCRGHRTLGWTYRSGTSKDGKIGSFVAGDRRYGH